MNTVGAICAMRSVGKHLSAPVLLLCGANGAGSSTSYPGDPRMAQLAQRTRRFVLSTARLRRLRHVRVRESIDYVLSSAYILTPAHQHTNTVCMCQCARPWRKWRTTRPAFCGLGGTSRTLV